MALPTRDDDVEEPPVHSTDELQSEASTLAAPSETETPATSQAPSESDMTQVSTPATPAQVSASSPTPTSTQFKQPAAKRDARASIAVPNIPGLAKVKGPSPPATAAKESAAQAVEDTESKVDGTQSSATPEETVIEASPASPLKATPKSWADLLRKNAGPQSAIPGVNGGMAGNGIQLPPNASIADALKQYQVQNDERVYFIEPRGLVNTGNMCYMNSVSLVLCSPKMGCPGS